MYKMEIRYAATVPQQFVGVNDIVEEEEVYENRSSKNITGFLPVTQEPLFF